MKKEELQRWEEFCALAQGVVTNVYSSTFWVRRNISIVDQQSRCFNLCWGLAKTGRVRAEHHVAIVGGGISGLTCAVALAGWTDCLVSVFERDDALLKRFRRAAHRYVHPDLNHSGGMDGNLVDDPRKPTNFPFMNWAGNYAPAFAEELVKKFDHYRAALNIALYLGTEVGRPRTIDGAVALPTPKSLAKKLRFDLVILATGFGEERFGPDSHTNDTSYWLSGNPSSYRASPLRRGAERILVSGNGDSAIIEIAQLLIQDFTHDQIFRLLPRNDLARWLNRVYASQVENLAHRKIEDEGGIWRWYWSMRELQEMNPGISFFPRKGPDLRRDLFTFAHSLLGSYDQNSRIEKSKRAAIEREIRAKFDELASVEIQACLKSFILPKIFSRKLKKLFRRDVAVTVTGRSPTIYSTVQAPLNWFLLRVLMHYGGLRYRRTELEESRLVKNLIHCRFKDGPSNGTFHRVITRHGPDYRGYSSDTSLRSKEADIASTKFFAGMGFVPAPEYFLWTGLKKFLGKRLSSAQRRVSALVDAPYPGSIIEPSVLARHADTALWFCHGRSQFAEAETLFRRLKKSRSLRERISINAKLLKLAQQCLPS